MSKADLEKQFTYFLKIKFLISFMLITSCTNVNTKSFKDQAENFCKCHSGISILMYNTFSFLLICNDGISISGKGPIGTENVYFNCRRK